MTGTRSRSLIVCGKDRHGCIEATCCRSECTCHPSSAYSFGDRYTMWSVLSLGQLTQQRNKSPSTIDCVPVTLGWSPADSHARMHATVTLTRSSVIRNQRFEHAKSQLCTQAGKLSQWDHKRGKAEVPWVRNFGLRGQRQGKRCVGKPRMAEGQRGPCIVSSAWITESRACEQKQ